MRRRLSWLVGCTLIASTAVVATSTSPSQAQCPGMDGTVMGAAARAVAIRVGDEVYYYDDRDYLDLDDDGDAGGIWIYKETNGHARLQRGGSQYAFEVAEDNGISMSVPRIEPMKLPTGQTLFPNGLGGGDLASMAGSHDDCVEHVDADSIVF